MNTLYKTKSYFEEILLGSNIEGIGFINESSHNFYRKNFFTGYNAGIDLSNHILSVGLLNNNILEIGVDQRLAKSITYCNCLKHDVCRKTSIPLSNLHIQAKKRYQSHYLNLNAGNKVAHLNLASVNGWGTLGGFLIPQRPGGVMHIVSNNHVLANLNNAKKGDPIYYMNSGPSQIGNLKNFTYISPTDANYLDLAIAEIPGFINNGMVAGSLKKGDAGNGVYKVGAKTGLTYGTIRSMHYTAKIDFGEFNAVFVDQMQIISNTHGQPFSEPGDSGSLIRLGNNAFTGLLFAGNDQWTLANHVADIHGQLRKWGYL